MKSLIKIVILLNITLVIASCENALKVTPRSEFGPGNVLTSEDGIRSLLFSAYAQQQTQQNSRFVINNSEMCTDMAFNSGGAENGQLVDIINFTWDPDLPTIQADIWAPNYRCIRDANGVIENIDNVNTSDANKRLFKAEARVLRAYSYANLYSFFGPVPLRTSTAQSGDLARASDDEMKDFVANEIVESVGDLPDPGNEESYGRFNKGVAYAALTKFYLNTKQWQKAADAAKPIIDFNYYTTTQYEFKDLFRVENEGISNKEMILVLQCRNETDFGNWFQAGALPSGYKSSPDFPDYAYQSTMANFATQYRLRTDFVNTMDPNDKRRSLICTNYINNSNVAVNILNGDNARSFKYWDNNTVGNNSGTDVPIFRYADILLSRAEALNELNSTPPTESFNLINQVRQRAGLQNLTLGNTPNQESFRKAVFNERGWEFISEGKRREDLIRQGTFISSAIVRGLPVTQANPNKILFPIPQSERQANKLCEQNPGYN